MAENVLPQFPLTAERSKIEELLDACRLQLQPADRFQISGNHAKQFLRPVQYVQEVADRRTEFRREAPGVAGGFGAHATDGSGKLLGKLGVGKTGAANDGPQDAHV